MERPTPTREMQHVGGTGTTGAGLPGAPYSGNQPEYTSVMDLHPQAAQGQQYAAGQGGMPAGSTGPAGHQAGSAGYSTGAEPTGPARQTFGADSARQQDDGQQDDGSGVGGAERAPGKPRNATDPDANDPHGGFGATDTGAGATRNKDDGTGQYISGAGDLAGAKGSWLSQLVKLMWPHITAAAEKQAKAQLPPLLDQNKPTWMTELKLRKFELGNEPITIEDVRVFPGDTPGAEDAYIEFDFEWRGKPVVQMDVNPAPKFLSSAAIIGNVINKIFTWTVGVRDISIKGRLRTTLIPLLYDVPVVGATQFAFVDPPKLDFDLTMGTPGHSSGLLDYVEGWLDGFITDNLLSTYTLPDHFCYKIDPNVADILTPEGVMEVRLIEAQGVPKADWIQSPSPFVKMWLRPRSLKKSTTKKGYDVKWQADEALYGMPVHVKVHQVLTVALWDEDMYGADELGRGHFYLKDLEEGVLRDIWIDVGKPKKAAGRDKGTPGLKDKLVQAVTGAKGASEEDTKGTRVHLQLHYHPMSDGDVERINAVQMQGGTRGPQLIHDPVMRGLVEQYDLFEEMFGDQSQAKQTAQDIKSGKGEPSPTPATTGKGAAMAPTPLAQQAMGGAPAQEGATDADIGRPNQGADAGMGAAAGAAVAPGMAPAAPIAQGVAAPATAAGAGEARDMRAAMAAGSPVGAPAGAQAGGPAGTPAGAPAAAPQAALAPGAPSAVYGDLGPPKPMTPVGAGGSGGVRSKIKNVLHPKRHGTAEE